MWSVPGSEIVGVVCGARNELVGVVCARSELVPGVS